MNPEILRQQGSFPHVVALAIPGLLVSGAMIFALLKMTRLSGRAKRSILSAVPLSLPGFVVFGLGRYPFTEPAMPGAWSPWYVRYTASFWLLCVKLIGWPALLLQFGGFRGFTIGILSSLIWIFGVAVFLWMMGGKWFLPGPLPASGAGGVASARFGRQVLKGFGVLAVFLASMGLLLYWKIKPDPPSDASLERQFRKHRSEMESLVAMMGEDRTMSRIDPAYLRRQDDWEWPRAEAKWGISRDRWNQYRELFYTAGIRQGIERGKNSSDTLLLAWSWGLAIGGSSIAYLHCGEPGHGDLHTAEACIEMKESGTHEDSGYWSRYKEIVPGWYIVEERD